MSQTTSYVDNGEDLETFVTRYFEAQNAVAEDKAKTSEPSKRAIAAFDSYDYERLMRMGSTDVEKIEDITDENLALMASLLQSLIRKGKIYMMDKENGTAWRASVVVGYNKGGLLIAHER